MKINTSDFSTVPHVSCGKENTESYFEEYWVSSARFTLWIPTPDDREKKIQSKMVEWFCLVRLFRIKECCYNFLHPMKETTYSNLVDFHIGKVLLNLIRASKNTRVAECTWSAWPNGLKQLIDREQIHLSSKWHREMYCNVVVITWRKLLRYCFFIHGMHSTISFSSSAFNV